MSPLWRRRHEIALLALMLIIAALVGFWFGRVSAPDPSAAFERGKEEGVAVERARHDQTQMEFDTLKGEIEAARSQETARSAKPGETGTSDPAHPTAASGANNR